MSYRDLIKDLKSIVSKGMTERKQDLNLATTHTNWELGKRIVEDEQGGEARAVYGGQVLERISTDLKRVYGRGFGSANLKYMRQFYQLYLKKDIKEQLQWSHYKLLLKIKDKGWRKQLERQVIKKNWTYRDLLLQIQITKGETAFTGNLERPTGITGIQQIRHMIEDGQKQTFLDLGFHIWAPDEHHKLNRFEDRQLVFVEKHASSWDIEKYVGDKQNRWLYKARLDHIVDGDTIVVIIELGLGIRTRQILRLQSVNTAPLTEKIGLQARDFVASQIETADYLLLRTNKRDKYARFVADILIGHSNQSVAETLESGVFLNQALLDQNLAIWAG